MVIAPVRALATIAVILTCSDCATQTKPVPFTTDGCSRFPDGSLSQREL
jgi:hypothetical protein